MNSKILTSVSKGCFVVPAKKKKSRNTINPGDYFSKYSSLGDSRWEVAEKIWSEMDIKIKALHSKLTSDIFIDLLDFVKNSYVSDRDFGGRRAEIPSAALITGVNMPDHTGLFQKFAEELTKSITPHVAVLCAKNCPTMKSLMRCIGQQLILKESEELHNISIDGLENHELEKGNFMWKRSIPLTMPLLEKWYSKTDHSLDAQNTKKKMKSTPIVIVLRDIEAFLPHLLQDLIAMFSAVINSLPIVFVFGVATSWTSVVDRQLPHSATVHLGLEKFYAPSASQHLSLIIDEVLLNAVHPFKLTGRCMQLLLDIFLCHDFSVTNFLFILKFCVLEHFYDQPAAAFTSANLSEVEKRLEGATPEILKQFQDLPSIKKYFESLTHNRKQLLQKSDVEFRKIGKKMLQELHFFHQCFFPVLRALFSLCKSLPRHPLGRHLRELYCTCDHNLIVDSEEYKQAKLFLQVSSREQLTERLQSCVKELDLLPQLRSPNDVELSTNYLCVVHDAKTDLETIITDLIHYDDNQEEEDSVKDVEDDENHATMDAPLEKVKYAYQLKEKLQSRSKEKKFRKMNNFEKLRTQALEILDAMFTKILLPPRSFPLYEVFYFDSTSTIRRHMIAAPRLAIQTALSNPHYYLQQPSLDVTDGVIPPAAPDVCIAYKLHNECGRIINLYDWLEAFHTIVNSVDDGSETDDNKFDEINEVTQARFIRAASELQFLGFIKPTKRKTDHVQRLTWSHS